MKYLLLLCSALLCAACSTPPLPKGDAAPAMSPDTTYLDQDTRTRVGDFNGDGVRDTLREHDNGGSLFSFSSLQLTDGNTGAVFTLETESYFGSFRTPVYVPPALADPRQAPFLSAMLAWLPPLRPGPDPSLRWILHGLYYRTDDKHHPVFDKKIQFPNDWLPGEPTQPDIYTLEISPDSLLALPGVESTDYEPWKKEPGARYFLIYWGHSHYGPCRREKTPFTQLLASGEYAVWATCHGLVVSNAGRHKWVFVSETGITGAPAKLRWPSIGPVAMQGKYLFLQHLPDEAYDGQSRVWVIDVEDGVCARFRDPVRSFALENDRLILQTDQGEKTHKTEVVFNALQQ